MSPYILYYFELFFSFAPFFVCMLSSYSSNVLIHVYSDNSHRKKKEKKRANKRVNSVVIFLFGFELFFLCIESFMSHAKKLTTFIKSRFKIWESRFLHIDINSTTNIYFHAFFYRFFLSKILF